jgi:hypothetical protein
MFQLLDDAQPHTALSIALGMGTGLLVLGAIKLYNRRQS